MNQLMPGVSNYNFRHTLLPVSSLMRDTKAS